MVNVYPFKGIRYNIKDLDKLITEPYDKISKELQRQYYKDSPYNFIRLNLPDEPDPYNSAKDTIKKWLDSKIMLKDGEPYFYQYIQNFNLFGKNYQRYGMFAAVKLEEYSERKILPHERTFKGPKEDRLKMLRATNIDLEPVFFLYDDPEMFVKSTFEKGNRELETDVEDKGIRHTIYRMKSKEISRFFEDKKLVIADGHHRYETALNYAKEMGFAKGTGYIMAVLVNKNDPGLVILPSHRVIKASISPVELLEKLKRFFNVTEIPVNEVKGFINQDIVYCFKDHAYAIEIKKEYISKDSLSQNLNVSYLNNFVFSEILKIKDRETITFERWPDDVWRELENDNKVAFMVRPVSTSTVWNVAMKGEIMPEKSTDFYPKLISGLKLMDLSDSINSG
jgi:uncharacterized protein (DUF1015 family)